MNLHIDKFCVYHHYVGRRLIYIGTGSSARPFQCWNRTEAWEAAVGKNRRIRVKIIQWFNNAVDARRFEELEILEYHPEANLSIPKLLPVLKRVVRLPRKVTIVDPEPNDDLSRAGREAYRFSLQLLEECRAARSVE